MRDNTTFMGKYSLFVLAAVLAVAIGGYATYRIEDQSKKFHREVRASQAKTGNHDEQYVALVNRLEAELAERASFGYAGSRDPMTGATRVVVAQPLRSAGQRRTISTRSAAVEAPVSIEEAAPVVEVDPVRLTAIIFDNTKGSFTAIVMDGTRSFSVEVGDRIAGRRIMRITHEEIHMENDTERFVYNIMGGNTRVQK